ncbi:AraC family transcriptional regulator [Amycolatopsis saalfeldensis]|uniref:helix-turn-helix transcriptional regulator n=1 Tax=Amycolatopsis saalfeldensis TaxID=394193 RepID=UPI00318344BE
MLPGLIAVSPGYERRPNCSRPRWAGTGRAAGRRCGHCWTWCWSRYCGSGTRRSRPPAIAAALRQIHEHPEHPWTVAGLGELAGLPRTACTRRFTELVGQSPMRYLTGWRLGRGARLLRETDASLATIARQVGYSTEFAFAGAFRREYGVAPGRFRHAPSAS